jgi:Protein of unknown function (DUF3179)
VKRPKDGPTLPFLRSGGWVILVALVLTAGVIAFHVANLLGSRTGATGDGKNVASYGFDLSNATVPVSDLVASGMPKDGLPALIRPDAWTAGETDSPRGKRNKLLVPSDRVIGVQVGRETRAYPLRILVWHEIVNDELGGLPVVVTYNPLCDSAVVFDRTVAGAVRTFGMSGLLYQSNLLLYDRQPSGKGESLWSQLLFRAVTGPEAAAGTRLRVLPSAVLTWDEWRAAHPDTTVLAPDPRLASQYKRDPYSSYFSSDLLHYAVRPLPPPERGAFKTRLIALFRSGLWHAFPFPLIADRAGADGLWQTTVAGAPVTLRIRREHPQTVEVVAPDEPIPSVTSFLFAWYATHGTDTVWHP